jgi:aspartate aminotransferase
MMTDNKHYSLNINVRGLGVSPTLRINERCNELRSKGIKVYNLGLGQSPFPVPLPVVETLKLHATEKKYLPVKGLMALRKAVADFHRRKDNVNALPENVLIGPGSKQLMFLLQLVFYGEIIIPTPCWVSYFPQAQIIGRKVSFIPTTFEDKWKITAKKFEQLCKEEDDEFRPRLLVLNYPGNPDGGSYSAEELKDIAEVPKRYEALLLSDEIYAQLHHRDEHVSVARFYPEGTIISSGLSKWCGAGGWRLGTFTFPSDLECILDAMASVASETYTSVSSPIQYAAVRAFRGGLGIEHYLFNVRRILTALGNQCASILSDAGIRVHSPTGAFYLFLDFTPFADRLAEKGINDSRTLCERILKEKGVAGLPGVDFERPCEEFTMRIAYVNFDGPKTLAASETVPHDQELPVDFTQRFCGETIEAANRIAEWISGI